jgi:hypothetical protein
LWILGRYGKFERDKSTHLAVDARTYEANRGSEKKLAIWSFVEENAFKVLSEFGVCCERIALKGVKEEDLTTSTGYLRSQGWIMRMSFEEEIGGTATLRALQEYANKLERKHRKKAFKHFSEANMQVLLSCLD